MSNIGPKFEAVWQCVYYDIYEVFSLLSKLRLIPEEFVVSLNISALVGFLALLVGRLRFLGPTLVLVTLDNITDGAKLSSGISSFPVSFSGV